MASPVQDIYSSCPRSTISKVCAISIDPILEAVFVVLVAFEE